MATDNDGGYMPVADVENALPAGTKNYLRVKILNKDAPADGMPEAPADGPYVAEGDAWSKLEDSTPFNYFTWSADTVTPPAAGVISANAADLANVTELRVSTSTNNLIDVVFILEGMGSGNSISLTQDKAGKFGSFRVKGKVTSNLLYYTIPVEFRGGSTSFDDASNIIFDLYAFENGALSFSVLTRDRIPLTGGISTDPLNPTYLTSLEISEQSGGFELVTTGPWANTGAVLNNTGFDIDALGTFSYYPDNSGGISRVDMWSETSADGITITENADSARSIEIAGSGESSGTKSSRFTNWPNGSMVRFAFTDTGGGACAFLPLSVTSTQGTVSAPAFSFQETAVRKF